MHIRQIGPGFHRMLGTMVLLIAATSAVVGAPVQAAASPNGPGHIIRHGTATPQTGHIAQTTYPIGPDGFDGETSASDPSSGFGDDQWSFQFNNTMKVAVTLTDEFIVGDSFKVYVDDTPIGTTPFEPIFGSTYSMGTETANVAPGPHTIYVQDVGALYWYNQGYTVMFPAGFHITIQFGPFTLHRSIIFVHGITQDASQITATAPDKQGFGPVLSELQSIYGTQVDVMPYIDDVSKAHGKTCPSTIYPPCVSQGPVLDNALALAKEISKDYAATHHKVVLIGYSMGAAIIRTLLAGCPNTTALGLMPNYKHLTLTCSTAHMLVDNVFFINGVQQGSWLMDVGYGLRAISPSSITTYAVFSIISFTLAQSLKLNLSYPAEGDLTPFSTNIQAHDAQPLPNGIHYFNFYGDIRLHLGVSFLIFTVQAPQSLPLGDLVIFPGQDDPSQPTLSGGARFCPGCTNKNGYSARIVNATTTFDQWALTQDVSSSYHLSVADLPNLGVPDGLVSTGKPLISTLTAAPMDHTAIPFNTSSIMVADPTRPGHTTSIADEIVRQLESQDGIVPAFTE